jgi:uncharacterized protein involved in exopolysaccharide biosynthesis
MKNHNKNDDKEDFVPKNKVTEIPLDFKVVIGKVLSFLPIFILSIGFSMLIAWTVTRYSESRFSVSGSILLKEKARGSTAGLENFIEGMELLSVNRNIENEIAILRSKKMVLETIKKLDFGISVKQKGSILDQDLFRNTPFIIEIDSNHVQLMGTDIKCKFIDDKF